jgi:hypothetical protein
MIDAVALLSTRIRIEENAFVELVIWQVPQPRRGSTHRYKYRLALVVDNVCVLRYDNEAGKGDHKHVGNREEPYAFPDVERLRRDFLVEARAWLERHRSR